MYSNKLVLSQLLSLLLSLLPVHNLLLGFYLSFLVLQRYCEKFTPSIVAVATLLQMSLEVIQPFYQMHKKVINTLQKIESEGICNPVIDMFFFVAKVAN
jgi:hypothetical protein